MHSAKATLSSCRSTAKFQQLFWNINQLIIQSISQWINPGFATICFFVGVLVNVVWSSCLSRVQFSPRVPRRHRPFSQYFSTVWPCSVLPRQLSPAPCLIKLSCFPSPRSASVHIIPQSVSILTYGRFAVSSAFCFAFVLTSSCLVCITGSRLLATHDRWQKIKMMVWIHQSEHVHKNFSEIQNQWLCLHIKNYSCVDN